MVQPIRAWIPAYQPIRIWVAVYWPIRAWVTAWQPHLDNIGHQTVQSVLSLACQAIRCPISPPHKKGLLVLTSLPHKKGLLVLTNLHTKGPQILLILHKEGLLIIPILLHRKVCQCQQNCLFHLLKWVTGDMQRRGHQLLEDLTNGQNCDMYFTAFYHLYNCIVGSYNSMHCLFNSSFWNAWQAD